MTSPSENVRSPWASFLAHLWLAWTLLARPWYTRMLAIGMSVVEILIITTLFIWFLAEPVWLVRLLNCRFDSLGEPAHVCAGCFQAAFSRRLI